MFHHQHHRQLLAPHEREESREGGVMRRRSHERDSYRRGSKHDKMMNLRSYLVGKKRRLLLT